MKLLFFDYDGTLYSPHTKTIPQSTYDAFDALHKAGHKLFLNSGRTKGMLDPLTYTLPFDGMILSCGCQIELDDDQVFLKRMEQEAKERLVSWILENEIEVIFADETYMYCTPLTDERMVGEYELLSNIGVKAKPISTTMPVLRCFIDFRNADLAQDFRSRFDQDFEYIDRYDYHIELIPKGFSKATGVEEVISYYGVDEHDCYVFGDSNNDLPVFERFENSVLLEGEAPELAQIVKYTTESVDEDGLAHSLERLGLLECSQKQK